MPIFPYFGFPNYFRRNYNYYNTYMNNYNKTPYSNNKNIYSNLSTSDSNSNNSLSTDNMNNVDNSNKKQDTDRFFNEKNPSNSYLFELFGLKLHFDDILLVCLIYFLYNEGVKDEGLFIALILLLLS